MGPLTRFPSREFHSKERRSFVHPSLINLTVWLSLMCWAFGFYMHLWISSSLGRLLKTRHILFLGLKQVPDLHETETWSFLVKKAPVCCLQGFEVLERDLNKDFDLQVLKNIESNAFFCKMAMHRPLSDRQTLSLHLVVWRFKRDSVRLILKTCSLNQGLTLQVLESIENNAFFFKIFMKKSGNSNYPLNDLEAFYRGISLFDASNGIFRDLSPGKSYISGIWFLSPGKYYKRHKFPENRHRKAGKVQFYRKTSLFDISNGNLRD